MGHKLSYIIILIFLIIFIEGCSKKTIPQLLQPPAPTNLIAEYISSDEIKLTWQDNSDNELGFKIERKKEGEDWTEIATVGENITTYNDTGLTPETTYYYRVKAYNSAGDSDYSNEVKIYLPLISTEPSFSLMGFATLGGGTTGGENGEVVYVNTGVDLQKEINKGGPRIIYVNGTITPENTAGKYVIYVKNVSKISIIGVGTSGELNGVGIKINNANNIIIRNLKIHNVKDPNIATQGPDCITIEGPAKNIWIDHCTFKSAVDSNCDITRQANYVTLSWNRFENGKLCNLILE